MRALSMCQGPTRIHADPALTDSCASRPTATQRTSARVSEPRLRVGASSRPGCLLFETPGAPACPFPYTAAPFLPVTTAQGMSNCQRRQNHRPPAGSSWVSVHENEKLIQLARNRQSEPTSKGYSYRIGAKRVGLGAGVILVRAPLLPPQRDYWGAEPSPDPKASGGEPGLIIYAGSQPAPRIRDLGESRSHP